MIVFVISFMLAFLWASCIVAKNADERIEKMFEEKLK